MLIIVNSAGNVKTISEKSYSGDKTGGELDHWETFGADPNDLIYNDFDTLVNRQVALYIISPIAVANINKSIAYSIGDGVVFRSQALRKYTNFTETQARKFSNEFTEMLHLEKTNINYYEKQQIMMREALITGDSLLHFLPEDTPNGAPFDIIIEGGYEIDNSKHGRYGVNGEINAILGVVVDKYKRRLGIVRKQDPDHYLYFKDDLGDQQVIMLLNQERAGQMRGYGRNFKIISMLKQVDRALDAVVERMVQESIHMAYFQSSDSDPIAQLNMAAKAQKRDTSLFPSEAGNDSATVEELDRSIKTTPGKFYVLNNKESLKFTDMKAPSSNFKDANAWFIELAAMSSGYPPEFISSKYNTSYTAAKAAMNAAWKRILMERITFCRIVDNVVNWEFLKAFIRRGDLKVKADINDPKVKYALLSGKWLGPVPGHLNPAQEISAYEKAEQLGYLNKSDIATQNYGVQNWEAHFAQWEKEQEEFYNATPEQKAKAMLRDQQVMEQEDDQNNTE